MASAASSRYVDSKSQSEFDEFDGQEIHAQLLIPVAVDKAFDGWISHVWKGIGMDFARIQVLDPGSGRGCVGSLRCVPGGIQEKITSAGEPSSLANSDKIPSITYRVVPGIFPADEHMGFVQFVEAGSATSPATLVIWDAKIIPSLFGSVFCCGGTILRIVSRMFFQKALDSLQHHISS